MPSESVLSTREVVKDYGEEFKLGPVSMNLNAGSTVALLGKNGAGKSTLFQIITGSLDATSGNVEFLGQTMRPEMFELKRQMGYLPQNLLLPKWVTGVELLLYASKLQQLSRHREAVEAVMKFWDCDWYGKRPLAACSHGMQKRVALALATLHDPELLILDEPFSGLDLFHIRALNDTIAARTKAGKVTIVCTHIAPYAAKLCQEAYVLEAGNMHRLDEWRTATYDKRIGLVEEHFFSGAPG